MAPVYYKKMAFIAFFNAGVRALDIRDPYHPKEVGYFIPSITAATDKRCVTIDGKDRCKVAIQTNNVETDERGYIYIVDRANTGLHILELTGAGARRRRPAMRSVTMRRLAIIAVAVLARSARCPALRPMRTPRSRGDGLARDRLAVSARRLARGPGVSLRCASCGDDVEVYVRPKIGFCNCDRGVADDDEVDRVADLDLISERFVPLDGGRGRFVWPICTDDPGAMIAADDRWLAARRRRHRGVAALRPAGRGGAGQGDAAEVQRAAMKFLDARDMKQWMTAAMDGALRRIPPSSPVARRSRSAG